MEPDKARPHKTQHGEFGVAHYAKEMGRTIQRRKLHQPAEETVSGTGGAHGEDSSFHSHANPPQHDRAG